MKKLKYIISLLLVVIMMCGLVACKTTSSATLTLNLATGDSVDVKCNTANGMSMKFNKEESSLTVSKNGGALLSFIFVDEQGLANYCNPLNGHIAIKDTGKDRGWSYSLFTPLAENDDNYYFIAWIVGSNTGIIAQGTDSRADTVAAFEAISVNMKQSTQSSKDFCSNIISDFGKEQNVHDNTTSLDPVTEPDATTPSTVNPQPTDSTVTVEKLIEQQKQIMKDIGFEPYDDEQIDMKRVVTFTPFVCADGTSLYASFSGGILMPGDIEDYDINYFGNGMSVSNGEIVSKLYLVEGKDDDMHNAAELFLGMFPDDAMIEYDTEWASAACVKDDMLILAKIDWENYQNVEGADKSLAPHTYMIQFLYVDSTCYGKYAESIMEWAQFTACNLDILAHPENYDVLRPSEVQPDNAHTQSATPESNKTSVSRNWQDYEFAIDGHVFSLGIPYTELKEKTGYSIKSSEEKSYLDPNYYTSTLLKDMNGDSLFSIDLLNTSDTEVTYADCRIIRIGQNDWNIEHGVIVEFPCGLHVGDQITKEKLVELFGEPTKTYEYRDKDGDSKYDSDTYTWCEFEDWTTMNHLEIEIYINSGTINEISLDHSYTK